MWFPTKSHSALHSINITPLPSQLLLHEIWRRRPLKHSCTFLGLEPRHTFIYIGWTPFITLLINAVRQEGVKDFLRHPARSRTREFSWESPQAKETPTFGGLWSLASSRAHQIHQAKPSGEILGAVWLVAWWIWSGRDALNYWCSRVKFLSLQAQPFWL